MLRNIKRFVRLVLVKFLGEKFFIYYHYIPAFFAAKYYSDPNKEMLVVAVTGTKGKTSTLNFLWHVLTEGGYKVGLISTANIKIGSQEKMNWYHMTMPGRFLLQKLLPNPDKSKPVFLVPEGLRLPQVFLPDMG